MTENKNKTDETLMDKGIAQLLHKIPYESRLPVEECNHVDDGYDYGKRGRKTIRRCDICGVYYEEDSE